MFVGRVEVGKIHVNTDDERRGFYLEGKITDRLTGRKQSFFVRPWSHTGSKLEGGNGKEHIIVQVLLRRLLTVETNLIVKGAAKTRSLRGELVIVFGFADPFARRPFHRALCPWSGSRYGTDLPRAAASRDAAACGR